MGEKSWEYQLMSFERIKEKRITRKRFFKMPKKKEK
jgi:hypothetical protein